jgi:hypothetical protein
MDKAEERYYLDLCLKLRPELSISEIQATESPDFIGISDGNPVGIELTRFIFDHHGGPSPAALDNYRNQLAKALREQHVTRNIPPVHVSVHFSQEQILLSRQDRSDLAERLLTFVAANIPAENESAEFDYHTLPAELYSVGVSFLNILRNRALTMPFWGLPNASFLPESTAGTVQALIDKKASNVAAYRKRVPQLWLMIISGTQGLQSILDLDAGLLDANYETEFDRLFLFRAFGGTVHELKRRVKPITG